MTQDNTDTGKRDEQTLGRWAKCGGNDSKEFPATMPVGKKPTVEQPTDVASGTEADATDGGDTA